MESGASQNCKDVRLTFQLGSLGMIFTDGGVISKVDLAGQAYLKGVQVGWYIGGSHGKPLYKLLSQLVTLHFLLEAYSIL